MMIANRSRAMLIGGRIYNGFSYTGMYVSTFDTEMMMTMMVTVAMVIGFLIPELMAKFENFSEERASS